MKPGGVGSDPSGGDQVAESPPMIATSRGSNAAKIGEKWREWPRLVSRPFGMHLPRSSKVRTAPKQKRSRRTLDTIYDATRRIVQQRGVEAVQIRGVARSANVSDAALYRYFETREPLLFVPRLAVRGASTIARSPREDETAQVQAFARMLASYLFGPAV
jgi:hypothetical protein